ncbi:MAG: SDR family NAD(P)-dependent oxidoreductase, partial [Pseudonocardiaceae bacterium]|nr:SDR family NAD(P)-dependent oxidoreductase [Pseudonocardiaceae bacterium]
MPRPAGRSCYARWSWNASPGRTRTPSPRCCAHHSGRRRTTEVDLLEGKSALVIGAGSGIGRAVARAYDREGARVAVMDIDRDKCGALRTELPDCAVSPGDATSMEQTVAAVNLAKETFGALDVL